MRHLKKIAKILGIAVLVLFFLAAFFYFYYRPAKTPVWGINFSPDQARYLGLDAGETFKAVLSELQPKKIRLVAYWENLESQRGEFIFKETDGLLKEAEIYGAKITLVVGRKQPRWPECHTPKWHKNLSQKEQRQALLKALEIMVNHFKASKAIERWQVENEPFFSYGDNCPVFSAQELKEEINLVKSLDSRPVVVSDSGEKGGWFRSAKNADIFGATMYRKVHNPRWGGYITYPLPPAWYRTRAGLLQFFLGRKPVINVELQAEPWFDGYFHDIGLKRQLELFDKVALDKNIKYAASTGLPEHYFWGAEWWYWMKQNGHPEFWDRIKTLIQPQ